jgi:hypothetical protein
MSSIDKCLFIYFLFLVCMKLAFYLFMFFGLVDWTMEIIGILKGKKKKILTKLSTIQGQVKYNSSHIQRQPS